MVTATVSLIKTLPPKPEWLCFRPSLLACLRVKKKGRCEDLSQFGNTQREERVYVFFTFFLFLFFSSPLWSVFKCVPRSTQTHHHSSNPAMSLGQIVVFRLQESSLQQTHSEPGLSLRINWRIHQFWHPILQEEFLFYSIVLYSGCWGSIIKSTRSALLPVLGVCLWWMPVVKGLSVAHGKFHTRSWTNINKTTALPQIYACPDFQHFKYTHSHITLVLIYYPPNSSLKSLLKSLHLSVYQQYIRINIL